MPATIIAGPCVLTWNSVNIFTKGDVKVEVTRNLFDIMTDQHGLADQRTKSAVIRITFTPSGRTTELAAIINYLTGKSPGQSVVPAGTGNEKSLVIHPLTNAGGASKIWTFLRTGPTAIGATLISATKTMAGQVTFTALASTVSGTEGSYYSTASYSAVSSGIIDDFTQANITTLPCRALWAADPDTLASGDYVFDSQDGWTLDINLKTKEHERESIGIADVTLTDITASLSGDISEAYDYNLAAITEATLAGLTGVGSYTPGQASTRKLLTLRTLRGDGMGSIDAEADVLTIPAAEMTAQGLAWGAESHRYGTVRFASIPSFTAGVRAAPVSFLLS